MADRSDTVSAPWRRIAIVAVLLAVTAAGLRVRSLPTAAHPLGRSLDDAATAMTGAVDVLGLALLVLILVAFAHRRRQKRRREDEHIVEEQRFQWWERPAALLAALAALAAPVVALLYGIRDAGRGTPQPPTIPPSMSSSPPPSRPGIPSPASDGTGSMHAWTWLLLAAAVAALGLLVIAGRRPNPSLPPRPPTASTTLATAVERAGTAGAAALRATAGGPRQAIIACYAAMERHLATAGAAPHASDTPTEVLTRAATIGAADPAAAGQLTQLFREARYSLHELHDSHRAAAERALSALHSSPPTAPQPDHPEPSAPKAGQGR